MKRLIAALRALWRSLAKPAGPVFTDEELKELDDRGGLW
jgi:hypothetical protein